MKVALLSDRVRVTFPDGRSATMLTEDAWELLDQLRRVLAQDHKNKLYGARSSLSSSTDQEKTK